MNFYCVASQPLSKHDFVAICHNFHFGKFKIQIPDEIFLRNFQHKYGQPTSRLNLERCNLFSCLYSCYWLTLMDQQQDERNLLKRTTSNEAMKIKRLNRETSFDDIRISVATSYLSYLCLCVSLFLAQNQSLYYSRSANLLEKFLQNICLGTTEPQQQQQKQRSSISSSLQSVFVQCR